MFRRSRKAKMEVSYFIAIALGIILLFIVGYYVLYKKVGGTAAGAVPLCNSDIQRCACFFTTGHCPSVYVSKKENSEMCPPDGWNCVDDESYRAGIENAKRTDNFGTCCQGPIGKVSPIRLKSYGTEGGESLCGNGVVDPGEECDARASLTECGGSSGHFTCGTPGTSSECRCIPFEEPAPTAADAYGVPTLASRGVTVDCTRIDECSDYTTDLICYHDPCGIGRCVSWFSGCDKNRFLRCDSCPGSCSMSDYCSGSDFSALRAKNPCGCR